MRHGTACPRNQVQIINLFVLPPVFFAESFPEVNETHGMWYHNTEGYQMLRLAMPPHAIGVNSTIRTSKGVHRMRFDRWGDHSHQFQPYNLKVPASGRSQNEINRYETERRRASSTPPHPSRRSNPGQEEYRNYNTSKRRNRMRSAPGMRSPYRPDTDDLSSSQDETWRTPYEYRNKGKGKKTRTSKKTESYYPPSPQYISNRHQTTDEEEEDRYSRRSSTSTQARPPTPERGYFPLRRSSTLDTLPQMPPAGEDVPDTELPVRQIGEAGQAPLPHHQTPLLQLDPLQPPGKVHCPFFRQNSTELERSEIWRRGGSNTWTNLTPTMPMVDTTG